MRDQLWCNIGNAIRIDHMDLAIAFCPTAKFTLVKSPNRILDVSRTPLELPQKSPGRGPGIKEVIFSMVCNSASSMESMRLVDLRSFFSLST